MSDPLVHLIHKEASSVVRAGSGTVPLRIFSSVPIDAADQNLPAAARWAILVCFLITVALFYVFTYNSGYGYDALEYLVIGRALAHGQPFYSLIPSKSPGIYYLIDAFLSLRGPANHYTVSALITLFFAASVIGTWLVVRRLLGDRAALVSALLVAASAAFMEMNFLEPESVVFLAGLVAFVLVLRSVRTAKLLPLFGAGVVLAIGFQFKSVAAFYGAGVCCFFLFKQFRHQHFDLRNSLDRAGVLTAGFLAGSIPLLLFFVATGRFSEFWTWTIGFPLLHYPSNTVWLDKLYTKLLWFHLLLVVSFLCSVFVVRIRTTVWGGDGAALAFFMGLVSYFSLLKTQSSHYCFPGAAFFSIFISMVLLSLRRDKSSNGLLPRRLALVAAVFLLLVLSAILYRPSAFSRFTQWRDFQDEALLGVQVKVLAMPGGKGLFVRNGSFLHWVSGVEPAWRFVSFDVQTTYFVERSPDSLLNALNDRSTSVVEFNPQEPGFEDERFVASANRSRVLAEFTSLLEKQFRPAEVNHAPFHFWVRKAVGER